MRNYKNIIAYKFADELVIKIYEFTRNFPKDEIYGLSSQLRRAAVSVATNITEGASRQHKKDYLNFLYISRGSLAEVEYLLSLAKRLGYLNGSEFEKIDSVFNDTAKTLFGLISVVNAEVN